MVTDAQRKHMRKHPKRTKAEWEEAGYKVAGIVKDAATYGEFHRMLADDWDFKGISHIIPIDTVEGAMEAYRERNGMPPCQKCFPKTARTEKVKDVDSEATG